MIKKAIFVSFLCIVFSGYQNCSEQGVFFREYWAEFDAEISNSRGRMLRVNDAELSLHEVYGKRPEALTNGFTLINVPEDLFGLKGADLHLEVWGGHPGTANKRFPVRVRPGQNFLGTFYYRPGRRPLLPQARPSGPGKKQSAGFRGPRAIAAAGLDTA